MIGLGIPCADLEGDDERGSSREGCGRRGATLYPVAVDISQLSTVPGLTADQVKTVEDAIGVLDRQGYTKTADTLSITATGRVLQSTTVTTFADGGTVTQQTTFSNLGAPGRVQMPSR